MLHIFIFNVAQWAFNNTLCVIIHAKIGPAETAVLKVISDIIDAADSHVAGSMISMWCSILASWCLISAFCWLISAFCCSIPAIICTPWSKKWGDIVTPHTHPGCAALALKCYKYERVITAQLADIHVCRSISASRCSCSILSIIRCTISAICCSSSSLFVSMRYLYRYANQHHVLYKHAPATRSTCDTTTENTPASTITHSSYTYTVPPPVPPGPKSGGTLSPPHTSRLRRPCSEML